MSDIRRKDGETFEDFFVRLFENKQSYGLNCQDIADILNEENGASYGESAYRKEYSAFNRGREYQMKKDGGKELEEKIVELKKENVKLSDQRREINKMIRNGARLEERFEKFEKILSQRGIEAFTPTPSPTTISDNDLLVALSDLHIGAQYGSLFGYYSTEIAQERLNKYLEEIIMTQKMYGSENCYVALLGDNISGNIHKSVAISNSENVIEQIKIVIDLVEGFLYELSKHFKRVFVLGVTGNHSRIDKKEDALKDERLDSLVLFCVQKSLSHINNIVISLSDNYFDSTIGYFVIRDRVYVFVHGDYDDFSKSGVSSLSMALGFIPYAVMYGHRHTPAFDEFNGIKMIRSGSLGGSGDDFTIEKRLTGKPSQTICVCNSKGIKVFIPVEFD